MPSAQKVLNVTKTLHELKRSTKCGSLALTTSYTHMGEEEKKMYKQEEIIYTQTPIFTDSAYSWLMICDMLRHSREIAPHSRGFRGDIFFPHEPRT